MVSYVSFYRDSSVQSEATKKRCINTERLWNSDIESGIQDTAISMHILEVSKQRKVITKLWLTGNLGWPYLIWWLVAMKVNVSPKEN